MRGYVRFKQVAFCACIASAWTAPAHANWSEAAPLIDGTCSSGASNGEGIIASAVMDRDESVDVVIGLRGQRGAMFVVNFSNGADKVFQARDNSSISFELTDEALTAFRDSSTFQLYKGGTGFIGSPFSLRGSSDALDTLISCVRSLRQREEIAAAGEAGAVTEAFSIAGIELGMNANQVKDALSTNGFAENWTNDSDTFRTQDASGRRITVHLRNGSTSGGVERFFMNVSGADTDVANIPIEFARRYGAPSAIDSFSGHKIWYRTDTGQVLRNAQASFLSCPGNATSRLVLRATKAGKRYISGSGGSVAATNDAYEIAVDNCRGI